MRYNISSCLLQAKYSICSFVAGVHGGQIIYISMHEWWICQNWSNCESLGILLFLFPGPLCLLYIVYGVRCLILALAGDCSNVSFSFYSLTLSSRELTEVKNLHRVQITLRIFYFIFLERLFIYGFH